MYSDVFRLLKLFFRHRPATREAFIRFSCFTALSKKAKKSVAPLYKCRKRDMPTSVIAPYSSRMLCNSVFCKSTEHLNTKYIVRMYSVLYTRNICKPFGMQDMTHWGMLGYPTTRIPSSPTRKCYYPNFLPDTRKWSKPLTESENWFPTFLQNRNSSSLLCM